MHEIVLKGPAALLACKIDLTITSDPTDPGNPKVDGLQLRGLSPWAKREAGDWLDERAKEGDVSAIGYALGRYWDVSVIRAQCWIRCCKELGDLVTCANDAQIAEANAAAKGKKRGNQARRGDADIDMVDAEGGPASEAQLSKRELHQHLGRQSLVLKSDEVILRISWKLQFDWTGEVESVVTAGAAFPKACK
jgi:hypothetical protein